MRLSRLATLLIVCLIWSIALTAQRYHATVISRFDLAEELPGKCIRSIFFDAKGKAFIQACPEAQLYQNIHLYEFDGYHIHQSAFRIEGAFKLHRFMGGITDHEGMPIGLYFSEDSLGQPHSVFFHYNPITQESEHIPYGPDEIHKGTIYAVASSEEGNYLLVNREDQLVLIRFVDGQEQLITSLEGTRLPQGWTGPVSYPCAIFEHAFWFADQLHQIHRIDLASGEWKIFPLDSIPTWMHSIYKTGDGRLLLIWDDFYRGRNFVAATFDVRTQQEIQTYYKPDIHESKASGMPRAFSDMSGNVIMTRRKPDGTMILELIDEQGHSHDYTQVLEGVVDLSDKQWFAAGQDFTKSVLVSSRDLFLVEVASEDGIEANPCGHTRGITEIRPGALITMVKGKRPQYVADGDHKPLPDCLSGLRTDMPYIRSSSFETWYLCESGQILRYDALAETCDTHQVIAPEKAEYLQRFIMDVNQQIVAWSSRGRIYFYNPMTRETTPYTESGLPVSFKGYCNDMVEDHNGNIWIGTNEGLYHVDRSGSSKHYTMSDGLSEDRINCLLVDHAGILWIGTYQAGVIRLDPKDRSMKILDVRHGLTHNTIAYIREDQDSVLWVGTYAGITLVTPEGETIGRVFGEDGLVDEECNRWSYYTMEDGRLCLGSASGISVIRPKIVKEQIQMEDKPMIYLTASTYYDATLKKNITQRNKAALNETIRLPATQRSLSLSFALTNLVNAPASTYAYTLEGHDNDWNYIGTSSTLQLNSLPAGKYRILVKGADHRGRWSRNIISYPVEVSEFFYRQWWFYVLCMIPFAVFAVIWIRRLQRERTQLETEVSKRTETIRAQADQLFELDKAKSRLYTNITHEFRTPLTVITGMADMEDLGQEGRHMIKRNARHLLNLINQMLDLRKLESGSLQVHYRLGDIVHYLRYLAESFVSIAEQKNIQLHVIPSLKVCRMDYDQEKLRQIVSNLLSNAIKFTPGGGNIYLLIDEVTTPEHLLHLRVQDTGVGIAPEKLDLIFRRFYQVEDHNTRQGEGTGIGLTLVAELVKLMEGRISVESEPGLGSTFHVYLPVHQNASEYSEDFETVQIPVTEEIPIESSAAVPLVEENENETLPIALIVEDNPDVLHYIVACLKDKYSILLAMNGQEGIDKAIASVPDIIISDVMMPVRDGFELCETLKEDQRTSHIPIVLLTAKADVESRLSGLRRGADAYLAKPFHKEELFIRLDQLIRLRKKLQARYGQVEKGMPEETPEFEFEDVFLKNLTEVIVSRLEDENLSIPQVAEALFMSRAQLHRKVKALTDKTPNDIIRGLRIREARRLLGVGGMTVAEVAYAVGFRDPSYFSKVFQAETGTPPSEFPKGGR